MTYLLRQCKRRSVGSAATQHAKFNLVGAFNAVRVVIEVGIDIAG